ncbi:hypothetical protein [Ornithinimicrobium tianjinense]|uniref:Uncharacterized protein n=1 Tax=Ornithinimicrobium tianjinense TaxID=1195761 RepID=A0A917BJT6_9MICO|nr:hypothetical protein [Ornithinimicrobium tianjinense]GGF48582.1 hypothetical protein GCM10011366_15530 [Ornithinimicrobium tianjinense]
MTQRLRLVGIMLMVFGLVFLGGSAVAFSMYQDGRHSLQSFSEVQGVELSYNDQGQLVDRGDPAAAQAIMDMLENEWGYPVSDREMDPDDPLVNTASEYMYQMATITSHVIHGTTPITLTEDMLVDADGKALTELTVNGETVPVPDPFPADGWTVEYENGGKYWNDFDRTNPADAAARPLIWTGTVHGLTGELGVGTVTASALKLALALVALLAGLGVINLLTGAGLYWAAGPRKAAGLAPAPVEQPELERIG